MRLHQNSFDPSHYRGWMISFDNPPIPMRDFDWSATSPDYDVDCDGDGFFVCSGQQVHAVSRDALLREIDAAILEMETSK